MLDLGKKMTMRLTWALVHITNLNLDKVGDFIQLVAMLNYTKTLLKYSNWSKEIF